jgi:hypothetical protein
MKSDLSNRKKETRECHDTSRDFTEKRGRPGGRRFGVRGSGRRGVSDVRRETRAREEGRVEEGRVEEGRVEEGRVGSACDS